MSKKATRSSNVLASARRAGSRIAGDQIMMVPLGIGNKPTDPPIGFCGGDGLIYSMDAHPTLAAPSAKPPDAGQPTGDGSTVAVWLDDPGDPVTVTRDKPDVASAPAFALDQSGVKPGIYRPGDPGFRYWTTAECLRRGGSFWGRVIGSLTWQTGATLPVKLDAGQDFNAFYDREALNFFHGDTPFGRVFSGESPDVACHEMGHAVLDAIKPELFDAASTEAAAFHEAFGDISAMLSALEIPEMRKQVIDDTGGKLYTSSRLSRLAEQLGAAIRVSAPQAVEQDCLRNLVNSFTYSDPVNLPHSSPASQLSSEPHSFSRVFSGAFLEALAGVLTEDAGGAMPTPDQLHVAAERMAHLLVKSVIDAPVVSNLFSQIAAGMVAKASAADAPILRAVFVGRSILSLESSMQVSTLEQGTVRASVAGETAVFGQKIELATMAIDASDYGLDKPLHLRSPGQARRYEVRASAHDASSIEPASAFSAARSFTNDLVRRGRVDFRHSAGEKPKLHRPGRFVTHAIEANEVGDVHLKRRCFDCGLRWD